jgi:hypothetical protein
MPTVISPAWEISYRGPTPDSGRRSAGKVTAVRSGSARPGKATDGCAVWSPGTVAGIRRITLPGARSMARSPMGSNSTIRATTQTHALAASVSTGHALTRITCVPSCMNSMCSAPSKTGVRPVTNTHPKTATSTRTPKAAEHVGPAEPLREQRKNNAPVTGSVWATAPADLVDQGAPSRSGRPSLSAPK